MEGHSVILATARLAHERNSLSSRDLQRELREDDNFWTCRISENNILERHIPRHLFQNVACTSSLPTSHLLHLPLDLRHVTLRQ